ncbi:hypothetical protein QN277_005902 [Acacia crassicarpa]|uniref:Uncharacterized protein n=1 Tax=Acacia crassicarpa TaxID=499986 RepID=A0AAE1MGU3_9FABA|nr:hypothetical protein QN277_005902 [Acacia crassicarpa]
MEFDFVDCDNDCMEFECNIESNPPSSPDINDIVGAPQLNPRLGDEYQVEIPSMTTEPEGLRLIVNPAYSEAMNNKSLSFALGLPVPLSPSYGLITKWRMVEMKGRSILETIRVLSMYMDQQKQAM